MLPRPPPSRAQGAGCGTAVGAGRMDQGAGRAGGSTTDSSPHRSAQPQGLRAVLTHSRPLPSRQCAAAVPLHSGRPQARSLINSFPPGTQKERWAPVAVRSLEAGQRQDPLVQRCFKSRRGRRAWSPCKKERGDYGERSEGEVESDPPLCVGLNSQLSNSHVAARRCLALRGHSKHICKVNECSP